MKVRAQSMKVRPVRWNPFPVEHMPDRYKQPAAAPGAGELPRLPCRVDARALAMARRTAERRHPGLLCLPAHRRQDPYREGDAGRLLRGGASGRDSGRYGTAKSSCGHSIRWSA